MSDVTIGELARRTGVHLETIRYYERIGLMPEPGRTEAGHRRYNQAHLARLQFIRRGRDLGFALADIEELLRLSEQRDTCCSAVSQIASAHLLTVRAKIEELRCLEAQLVSKLAECRPESATADCPVIELLAAG